ncbi:transglutaminase family protein [Aquirhabdus parva]|uniref:Transglutaminase family protein n=1 Tax=Aquirhabdus parva TaxID=2283318 RepID=A0A345P6X6_9GAMM|nr:transglutaminase family protein [Aquirhabdus parva]AXI03035.1 transglutaminase family protein [Aquirhabdus parva]
MKLIVNHQTIYRYDQMVRRSVQYLRMSPQTIAHQKVLSWQLSLPGKTLEQADGFGNVWTTLYLDQPHRDLFLLAQGEIEIDDSADYIVDERIAPEIFLHPTDMTLIDEPMREFTAKHLKSLDRSGLIAFAEAVVAKMPYTPGATGVRTTASEAFMLGHGVCQDHTHVFLACVRDRGLIARYVSGYLYTPISSHMASHAWAEVLLDGRWYLFDISNQIFTPRQHIQTAVGRDYLDAAPVRGVRQGGGNESLSAMVQVLAS